MKYAVILNFESGTIDVLTMDTKPKDIEYEDFIEETLNYSLSNCEWMITDDIELKRLNF